jgi:hypothetical protein
VDDKLKRELAAAVDRGASDASTQKIVARDPQARAYFEGLLVVDRVLRAWPERGFDAASTDRLVDAVLARLDEPSRDDFDPLAAPFADEREAQRTPRQDSEQQAMSQSKDQDHEDDLEGLAALMRPSRSGSTASVPPPPLSVRPGPALTDDAMDESSGIVDIKHLAEIAKRASVPPPSTAEVSTAQGKPEDKAEKADVKAEAKADRSDDKAPSQKDDRKGESKTEKASSKSASEDKGVAKKSGAKSEEKDEKEERRAQAVPPASAAAPAEKKGTSPIVYLLGLGIAAGGAFFLGRQGQQSTSASLNAESAPQTAPAVSTVTAGPRPEERGAPLAAPSGASGSASASNESAAREPEQAPAAIPAPQAPAAPVAPAAETQPSSSTSPSAPEQPSAPPASSATVGGAIGASAQESRPASTGAASAGLDCEGSAQRGARRGGESERSSAAARAVAEPSSGASAQGSRAAPAGATAAAPARTTNVAAAAENRARAAGAGATSTTGAAGSATGSAPAGPSANSASVAAAPAPARPAASVEELMRRATGQDRAEAQQQSQASASAALPLQLTTTMVRTTMAPFNAAVRACAQGQTGAATAVLTVNGDGTVANVVVSSPWGSGPNDCISNRLRTARFPAVQRPSSRIVVPFTVNPSQPGG